jgi:hypothetical protein
VSATIEVIVHAIADDGLPDIAKLIGRVAFIWDGAIVSGWPITDDDGDGDPDELLWEASEDAMGGPYYGVTHWVEFPTPVWEWTR